MSSLFCRVGNRSSLLLQLCNYYTTFVVWCQIFLQKNVWRVFGSRESEFPPTSIQLIIP